MRVTTPASASMVGRLKRINDMGDEVDCLRMCGGWKLFRGGGRRVGGLVRSKDKFETGTGGEMRDNGCQKVYIQS
jgi:hypothetical protein